MVSGDSSSGLVREARKGRPRMSPQGSFRANVFPFDSNPNPNLLPFRALSVLGGPSALAVTCPAGNA